MTAWRDERLKQNVGFTSITFPLTNADGSTTDLTGATASLNARYGNNEAAPLAIALTQSSGITLNGIYGTCFYTLTPAQVLAMTPGTINYDFLITLTTGEVRNPASGVWRLGGSTA